MKPLLFICLALFFVCMPEFSHADQTAPAGAAGDSAPHPKDHKLTIAILEFDAVNDEAKKSNKGRMVSEMLTTEAFHTGQFHVVERHQIKKVLDEMEFGDAAFSGGTAQKIGELLGADAVLTGSVSEFLGVLRMDARLIKVKDGRILLADSAQAELTMQAMSQAVREIMAKMLAALGGRPSPQPTAHPTAQPAAAPPASGSPARLLRPASIRSSSSLKASRYANYLPDNLLDNNPETVWVEGARGKGKGEWLELYFDQPRVVSKIGFMNGYNKIAAKDGSDRWRQNSRVKSIRITFSSGQSLERTLEDVRQWQYVTFPPVRTQSVRITLLQNYRGAKWPNDTCLSEIRVYGQ